MPSFPSLFSSLIRRVRFRPSAAAPCARLAGDDGEREDGGPGAGEESEGEGEGKGDQSERIFIEDRPAAGLDLGRLDPLDDQPGRPR